MLSTHITFEVNRFSPNATTMKDVKAFIAEHEANKHGLIIVVNVTGIGDAYADYLESNGFAVVRTNR